MEIDRLLKHLEAQRISVREFIDPATNRARLVGRDQKTGFEYCHEIHFDEAMHNREIVIHILRRIEDELLSKRHERMGVAWTTSEAEVTMPTTAGMVKLQQEMAGRNPWQKMSFDYQLDNRSPRTFNKFFRLGSEVELEEGATFAEPLDALRLSIARWLKK